MLEGRRFLSGLSPNFKGSGSRVLPLHDSAVQTLPRSHDVDMHATDLVWINGITRVLLVYTCQQGLEATYCPFDSRAICLGIISPSSGPWLVIQGTLLHWWTLSIIRSMKPVLYRVKILKYNYNMHKPSTEQRSVNRIHINAQQHSITIRDRTKWMSVHILTIL
jgi:hypothetical protein